jgi:hypothetical protein
MHEMDGLICQLDIESDVMNVRKKNTNQTGNINIKGKVKLVLNLEKNENQMNKQRDKESI